MQRKHGGRGLGKEPKQGEREGRPGNSSSSAEAEVTAPPTVSSHPSGFADKPTRMRNAAFLAPAGAQGRHTGAQRRSPRPLGTPRAAAQSPAAGPAAAGLGVDRRTLLALGAGLAAAPLLPPALLLPPPAAATPLAPLGRVEAVGGPKLHLSPQEVADVLARTLSEGQYFVTGDLCKEIFAGEGWPLERRGARGQRPGCCRAARAQPPRPLRENSHCPPQSLPRIYELI